MSENRYRAILAIAAIGLFVFPVLVAAAATPITSPHPPEEVQWWEDTLMDKDKDGIDDDIWVALNNTDFEWVDENGHIDVIVNLDHLPTEDDVALLENELDFVHLHTFHLIDSIAGSVAVDDIVPMSLLPGVVMVE